jgi:hypothetical protein
MIGNVCSPQYIRDQKGAGWQLNAIPVKNLTDNQSLHSYYIMYFPRPWIIVGFVDLNNSPGAGNCAYPLSVSKLKTPAIHAAESELFEALFLDLAYATTHDYDDTIPVNYKAPGIQAVDYRGYFTKYISENVSDTPEQWYNSLIQPESVIKAFCDNNAAATVDVWVKEWQNTVRFLELTTDQRMIGAPGIYSIRTTGTQNAYTNWNGQSDYEISVDL